MLDGVIAAGRSGAGAETVLPRLLLLTVVLAGLGFLSAIGREHREILAELASRHAQSQIIDVAARSSWRPTKPRPSTTGWSGRPGAASSGPGRWWRG
ncbi:MAG TPA: hypothetical protein VL330_16135 [Actinomycetes bacterium]|nr:hypothetical protein [Actinomycetes bacterium]